MYFVGIDIGTSSISGVAYTAKSRKIESVTVPNDAGISSAKRWERAQNPMRILEIVRTIIDDFSVRYTTIQGIGITGQMHGILYVNREGDAISPLYTWQDGRANLRYKTGMTYAAFLSEVTGHTVPTGFGLATHFYNSRNDLVPEGVAKICTITDFVVMKLVDLKTPVTDYSNAAGLGLFDVEQLNFDHAGLAKVGVDSSLLPDLAESTISRGHYRGIPVYMAIGDNQAAFLGSVSHLNSSIHVTVGTSSQVSVFSAKYMKIPGIETRPFPGGGYMLVGAALCGGQAFAMLRTFFEDTVAKFSTSSTEEIDFYKIMTSVTYKDDSSDLPIVETLFDGTRSAPDKRGHIENISTHNFTPDNLIIGLLKGICRELYQFYQALPEEVRKAKSVLVGSGNALKRNPLLCLAFEEQFNTVLIFSPYDEEAAFGACLNAIAGSKNLDFEFIQLS